MLRLQGGQSRWSPNPSRKSPGLEGQVTGASLAGYLGQLFMSVRLLQRAKIELRKRRLALNRPLQPGEFKAEISVPPEIVRVERGAGFRIPVRIANHGHPALNSTGEFPIVIRGCWLGKGKDVLDAPAIEGPIPAPVRQGAVAECDLHVVAPEFLGDLTVEVWLEQRGGPSFIASGNQPARIDVQVLARDSDDMDYHKIYSTADLHNDYWTVVGPTSKGEYEHAVEDYKHKLEEWLAREANVLDIGCGTGLFATACESYLGDHGSYFGVDIAPQAVAFCKSRFVRPNFAFAQSAPTEVPVHGRTFDFISLFSVFTHTYADETALLLEEAKRLLSPGGQIIADIFTSSLVERQAGNRLTIVLNEGHFFRLVRLNRLAATEIRSHDWTPHVQRRYFRMEHES
jgi:SAM-dependent methyltransferase